MATALLGQPHRLLRSTVSARNAKSLTGSDVVSLEQDHSGSNRTMSDKLVAATAEPGVVGDSGDPNSVTKK
jgi:hypothetical protein